MTNRSAYPYIRKFFMKSPDQNEPKPAPFDELEQNETVSAAELIATLRSYVEGGWSINPSVVIALIRRANPTNIERQTIRELSMRGAEAQTARHETKAAREYRTVALSQEL
jgi:hypothetical protein